MSTYTLSQQHLRAPASAPSLPTWGYRGTREASRLHLTTRGKVVISMLVIGVVGIFLMLGVNAVVGSTYEPTQTVSYTVGAGDSLWGVASSVAQPGQDVRDVVHAIQQINGLDSADIFVGQQLNVPVA